MNNKNYIYVFPSKRGTCWVIVYRNLQNTPDNIYLKRLDDFLVFHGMIQEHEKVCMEGCVSDTYECSIDLYNSMKRNPTGGTIQKMFKRFGFELVFEYPFKEEK